MTSLPCGFRLVALVGALLFLAGCSEVALVSHVYKENAPTTGKGATTYKVGKPYKVGGKWYYPKEDYNYREEGIASWYGRDFHGKATANGERYDMHALTAAHRTLPMPSFVRVTNLENGRSLVLRVNDRGPFVHNRIIDVSYRAAQLLGFDKQGTARVRVEILPEESRAIAERATGKPRVIKASAGPTAPKPAPRVEVNRQDLPPPQRVRVGRVAEEPAPQPPATKPAPPPEPAAEPVTVAARQPALGEKDRAVADAATAAGKSIFVQAGSFVDYENAFRLSSQLTGIGQVTIMQALVDGRDYYRVRLGPVDSMDEADAMLQEVVKAGHGDARLIVY